MIPKVYEKKGVKGIHLVRYAEGYYGKFLPLPFPHFIISARLTERFGMSRPAVTTKFVGTKEAIRKGNKIFSPVSGWKVASTTTC